jgi:hypothetical protein
VAGKSADVKTHDLNWYPIAKAAEWKCFVDVCAEVPDAENRLLDHKTYDQKEWVNKWP